MELSSRLLNQISQNVLALTPEDFQEVKHYYTIENKNFIKLMDSVISEYKKKENIQEFLFLMEYLHSEIKDISPFITNSINKVFILMIKNNCYKQIARYCDVLEVCANIKVLDLLNVFTKSQRMGKFLTNVEIYKFKKLVFDLSKKYNKSDIAYQIEVELEGQDTEWLENIEK
jgi:hypothetical protein